MKLLVADKLDDDAVAKIKAAGIDVAVEAKLTPEQLLAAIPMYDALAVRSRTKVTAAVIAAAKNVKLIVRAGVGLDNIDTDAATRRGIIIRNTPDATIISVAEHVMGLILALMRRIPQAHAAMIAGRWEKELFAGSELFGKTLGIVGLGRIGRAVAKRAKPFGMEVIATDPLVDPQVARDENIPLLSLDDLLARTDIITLHLPLSAETKGLLDAGRLQLMKRGARLINCSRGGMVDEAAVAEAVHSGQLAGAAFDVFENEPLPPTSPLRNIPNIILTPHLGAATVEGQRRAGFELADIVIAFSRRKK